MCNELFQYIFSASTMVNRHDFRELKRLREVWMSKIRLPKHRRMERLANEDHVVLPRLSTEDCKFCKPSAEADAEHVEYLCLKMNKLDSSVRTILCDPTIMRIAARHPNMKEKIKTLTLNSK